MSISLGKRPPGRHPLSVIPGTAPPLPLKLLPHCCWYPFPGCICLENVNFVITRQELPFFITLFAVASLVPVSSMLTVCQGLASPLKDEFSTCSRAPEKHIQVPAGGLHLDVPEACPTQNAQVLGHHLPPKANPLLGPISVNGPTAYLMPQPETSISSLFH